MQVLSAIGYWTSKEEPEFPDPRYFTGHPGIEHEAIIQHLKRGLVVHEWKGYSWCRFDCDIAYKDMGNSDLSDGVYIWPQGLAHYLQEHKVILPERFIEHVLNFGNWPATINPYAVRVDFDWWLSLKNQ